MKQEQPEQKGFIEIIVVIFIAVIVLSFFGINPKEIWLDYVLPVLEFAWKAFITIIAFVIELGIQLAEKLGLKK